MPDIQLSNQLARQIVDHIGTQKLAEGTPLPERKLAEMLRVSRTPVRAALRLLQEHGVVRPSERGGFLIATAGGELPDGLHTPGQVDEDVYLQVADDRLNGRLPDRITENEMLRRYGITRGRLAHIMRRITSEGWVERLPGHGWAFVPVLTSLKAYADSYRFRLLIEPAGILEPNFTLNISALEKHRDEQHWLVERRLKGVSGPQIFELNSALHETIIECSQNSFFIDALKKIDRARRLIDYQQTLDPESGLVRCKEHLHLLDLLLTGRRLEASEYLRKHLEEVGNIKPKARPPHSQKSRPSKASSIQKAMN